MNSIDPTTLRFDDLIAREWLLTNSAGGYSASTMIGLNTRKYHGLLVAAMAAPVRRMVILSRVEETVALSGRNWKLASVEYPGVIHPAGHSLIRAFNAQPYPRWAFQGEGWTIEKSVRFAPTSPNDLIISYTLLAGDRDVQLEIEPLFALRGIHDLMFQWSGRLEAELPIDAEDPIRIPATSRTPEVYFAHDGEFAPKPCWYLSTIYRRERERGYAGLEDLWMPGVVKFSLQPGKTVHFAVSTERVNLSAAVAAIQKQDRERSRVTQGSRDMDQQIAEELSRAAAQFVVEGAPKKSDAPHPAAEAASPWTSLIPQFPWTAMSVRDMLIALPGILLTHDRFDSAKLLLTKLAEQLKDGLIPSEIDEKGGAPAYNACDTSLWWIHAAWSYLNATKDPAFTTSAATTALQIIEKYRAGTSLGIGVNGDQLLRVRSPGIGCTWMNAKVGDWVITPRHGRPVEVNALWHNALRATAELCEQTGDATNAKELRATADKHFESFNRRFWNSAANCCFDVIYDNGEDGSIRPNQLFAISLPFPVLSETRWRTLLATVRETLLTPTGLRTLGTTDSNYQGKYGGDVVSRDRAYHQGCAYPWLAGPYSAALAKTFGKTNEIKTEIRKVWAGAIEYLRGDGLGQLAELFDGDSPHRCGGAPADARATGELSRIWHEEILGSGKASLQKFAGKEQSFVPSSSTLGEG